MSERTPPARSRLSMHQDIAVWCDCCSCEAEPYWQAVAEELGIELGSDYERGPEPENGSAPEKPNPDPHGSGF